MDANIVTFGILMFLLNKKNTSKIKIGNFKSVLLPRNLLRVSLLCFLIVLSLSPFVSSCHHKTLIPKKKKNSF